VTVLGGQRGKLRGVGGGVGAVEVKPAADRVVIAGVFRGVPTLVARKAVKNLHLDAGEKVRHPVARHKGGHRRIGTRLIDCAQQVFIGLQRRATAPGNEPGNPASAAADFGLQRAQDGIGVGLVDEEQVVAHAAPGLRLVERAV